MTEIAKLIKTRREELSMTQMKLAELAGFGSYSIIANIEQGRLPSVKHILSLSSALGIAPDSIIEAYMLDKKNQIAVRLGLITR